MTPIEFIQDKTQFELRKNCKIKTDRFEHTLQKYKRTFIDYFLQCKDKIKKTKNNQNNDQNNYILNIIYNIDPKQISDFFDSLTNVYLKWINSESLRAIFTLQTLLKKYNILDVKNVCNNVFYRGRNEKNFISHWDMFHIPFNKRYLIQNQRYSLVGQPILYLCSSPYCVYKELNNIENLKISSFRLKYGESFKFYDNTNKLPLLLNDPSDSSVNNKLDTKYNIKYENNKTEKSYYTKIKAAFFKLILSSCCSFQSNSTSFEYSFEETYILPQLLAQVLKRKKYDGVIYTSTKIYKNTNYKANTWKHLLKLYTNYCFFTSYDMNNSNNESYVYDKILYKKFIISTPIDVTNYFHNNYNYNIKESLNYIRKIISKTNSNNTNALLCSIINNILTYKYIYDSYKSSNNHNILTDDFLEFMSLNNLFSKNIITNIYEDLLFKEDLT